MNSPSRLKGTSRCWSLPSAPRFAVAGLLCLGCALAEAQAGLGLPVWLRREVIDRVTITGYRRLSMHQHQIDGDGDAFQYGNYGGQGDKTFTDFGNINVTGRDVLGLLNFEFVIQDSRYQDPQGQRFSIDVDRGPWVVNLGDIRGSLLNTNRFATFNKTLRGAQLGFTSGGFRAKTVYSDVRGAPRTVTIPGTNTAGPYYLQSSQIVRGSERIEVDGVPQTLGQDYIINYEIGSVTFVNRTTGEAKIIPPTSTIVAQYEVFGFAGSRGRVQGAAMAYNFGPLAVGVTGMQQIKGGSGGLSTRLEQFQGFGPPSTPYFLQFEPLMTEPIVIRVNGIIQTEGVDYFFDPDNPSIFFFTRFMPSTDNIDVLYTPKPTSTVDGDREVVGWDVNVPFGKSSSLRYSEATGRLTKTPTPSSGVARALDLRYSTGPFTLSSSLRSVPSGYVNIETTGFNRNENAADLRASWSPDDLFTYTLGYMNAAVASRVVDSGGDVSFVNSRFVKSNASVNFAPTTGGMPWTLGVTKTSNETSSGKTDVTSTELTTRKTGSNWDASLALQHQDARGPITDGSGTTLQDIALDSINLRTGYRPNAQWSFNLSTGLSQVRKESEQGTGHDVQFVMRWQPTDLFDTSVIVQDSDAGQIATLGGFANGYGSGYGGNGFSNGVGSTGFISASKVRAYTLRSTWSPYSGLSLSGRTFLRETQGSFSSNTRTTGVGFDANWSVSDELNVQASIDSSKTEFIDSPLSSGTTVFSAYVDGAPAGPWSYSLGYSALVSGSQSTFQQNSHNFDAALGYRLSPRQTLSFIAYSNFSSGQFGQDDTDLSINYRYQIWRSVALQASYRWRDVVNKDPLVSTGAYRSRGFDIELVFNFGS